MASFRRHPAVFNLKSTTIMKKTKTHSDTLSRLTPTDQVQLPIIGIGASAGGLEAIEQFLCGVPSACGMAFVIVQHLAPTHKDMMCEILQRITPMPVLQITDRMVIVPGHVYVIPPGFDLSILNGVLHLLEPTEPRGLRLPINYFLQALAVDQKQHGIAVILSGMGSDGTQGLRAIKEQGGAAFVQSPATAQSDGMPCSAIDAGLADIVGSPEELAAKIISYIKYKPLLDDHSDVAASDADQSGLEKIVVLLRVQTGQDFSLYKKSTLYRRVERRMALHQLLNIASYVRYLRANPQEATFLFKELLIGVTSFFRDLEVWEQLKTEILPSIFTLHPEGGNLRAWVPACSTGEEAYTLAIVFREALEQTNISKHYSLQVFATDLDNEAINKARAGLYPTSIAADLSEARLNRYFVKEGANYRISKEIREMVIFAPQNLVMDPPFTKLDILTCRNFLIYLENDLQKKLLPLFHYSLNPGGVLVLGSAETVGSSAELFEPCSGKTRIYHRRENLPQQELVEFPAAHSIRPIHNVVKVRPLEALSDAPPNSLQKLTDTLLLQRFTPAAVLTTNKGDIVYINGKTGKYLEPAAGKVNNNLFAMAREGLIGPLNEAFTRAVRQAEVVELSNIKVGSNGGSQLVDVSVHPLAEPAAMSGMVLVVFVDSTAPLADIMGQEKGARTTAEADQIDALAKSLEYARAELQSTREEMQTSQEELKSTNEELQSTNEELQSTNEELTTSKEEMQSMNEELQTVNQELNSKVDELSKAGDDMHNLLNSTDIATLFLDNDLKVRRFTDSTTSIINLIPSDAGRPVADLATRLEYPGLVDDAREVLRSLVFNEVQVASKDGRWFAVRIMPYRTQDHRIDGVVIVFADITVAKNASDKLFDSRQILLKILDNIPQRVYWKDRDSVYLGCNKAFAKESGYVDVNELIGKVDNQTALPNHYTEDDCFVMESGKSKLKLEEKLVKPEGKRKWLNSNKVPLMNKAGQVTGMLGTYEDISERKRLEEKTRAMGISSLQERFDLQTDELHSAKDKLQEKDG